MKKRRSSLENALTILKMFSIYEPELSVTAISKKLSISKSTAHRLLTSLLSEGFVHKDPQTNLYSLGTSILSLVNIVNSQIHISTEVIPLLNMLVEKTSESAHLAILEKQHTVYIQTMEGTYYCNDQIQLGTRKPVYETAAGQVILAFQPDQSNDQCKEHLSIIQANGFAIHTEKNVVEIAVPVYKNDSDVVASLSLTVDKKRITLSRIEKEYIYLLQQAADKLREMIQLRKSGKVE